MKIIIKLNTTAPNEIYEALDYIKNRIVDGLKYDIKHGLECALDCGLAMTKEEKQVGSYYIET